MSIYSQGSVQPYSSLFLYLLFLLFLFFSTDVVAYVEVRSGNDNRSGCIVKELTQLGAEVVPKFTQEVTHVIFKDGKKSTLDKAKKKGVHLVSVLWVDR